MEKRKCTLIPACQKQFKVMVRHANFNHKSKLYRLESHIIKIDRAKVKKPERRIISKTRGIILILIKNPDQNTGQTKANNTNTQYTIKYNISQNPISISVLK